MSRPKHILIYVFTERVLHTDVIQHFLNKYTCKIRIINSRIPALLLFHIKIKILRKGHRVETSAWSSHLGPQTSTDVLREDVLAL